MSHAGYTPAVRWIAVLAALVALTSGCGTQSQASAPPTPTPSAAASPSPSASGSGSATLVLTGAVAGNLSLEGSLTCLRITDQGPPELDISFNGSVAGAGYDLTVVIHNQAGPGDYPITASGNKVEMSTRDGNTIWDGYSGTLSVGAGNQGGTFDVMLGSGSKNGQPNLPVHLTGPFVCGR